MTDLIPPDQEAQVPPDAMDQVTGAHLFIKLERRGSQDFADALFRAFGDRIANIWIVAGHFNVIVRIDVSSEPSPQKRIEIIGEIAAQIECSRWGFRRGDPPPREVLVYYHADEESSAAKASELLGIPTKGKISFLVEITAPSTKNLPEVLGNVKDLGVKNPNVAVFARILNRPRLLAIVSAAADTSEAAAHETAWNALKSIQGDKDYPWTRSHMILARRSPPSPVDPTREQTVSQLLPPEHIVGAWLLIRLRHPDLTGFAKHLITRYRPLVREVFVTSGEVDIIARIETTDFRDIGHLHSKLQILPWIRDVEDSPQDPPHSVHVLYLRDWKQEARLLSPETAYALTSIAPTEARDDPPENWVKSLVKLQGQVAAAHLEKRSSSRGVRPGARLIGLGSVVGAPLILVLFGASDASTVWSRIASLREGRTPVLEPRGWTHSHVAFGAAARPDEAEEDYIQYAVFQFLCKEPRGASMADVQRALSTLRNEDAEKKAKKSIGEAIEAAIDAGEGTWCVRSGSPPRAARRVQFDDEVVQSIVGKQSVSEIKMSFPSVPDSILLQVLLNAQRLRNVRCIDDIEAVKFERLNPKRP